MLVLLVTGPFGDGVTMTVGPARCVTPSRVSLVRLLVSSLGLVNSFLGTCAVFVVRVWDWPRRWMLVPLVGAVPDWF